MNIQVLISTMNQTDYSLLDKMNIQTDAIVINQCDRNESTEFSYKGNKILWMSFKERGVGLSRNNALMRATSDICLMADDDMVYVEGYEQIVKRSFEQNPNADMMIFNVPIHKKNGKTRIKVHKNGRVNILNGLKYGTVNFAFKREVITKRNIYFSLLFGGGAQYSSGEDSLFLVDILKHKLKVHSDKTIIADIKEDGSTWFNGYNEKYLYDRGALFKVIGGKLSILLTLQFAVRHKKLFSSNYTVYEAFKLMNKGSKEYYKLEKDSHL